MSKREERRKTDERLDAFGREIVRASAADETLAESIASSPFLYTRLRARIAGERERRETLEGLSALSILMRRAVMAMSLVAFFALGLLVFTEMRMEPSQSFNDEALFNASNVGVQHVVFEDRDPLSNDEVLATIVDEDAEASK
ncbi:MAG: hypothetical protein WCB68_07810 [Pyrinomonadaceae bacterium]